MKIFNSDKTEKLFRAWLNSYPETTHAFDTERFHNFVYELFKSDDYISEQDLKNAVLELKSWENEKKINDFVEEKTNKINELQMFYNFLKEKSRLKE